MQIYQALEPDDFLMIEQMPIKPSTTTVRSFCARFSRDEYKGACLRESWPFSKDKLSTSQGVVSFCSGQPNTNEETNCYQSVSALVGRMSLNDMDKAARICAGLPSERQALCYTMTSKAVLEEDRNKSQNAIALCMKAPEGIASECITTLVSQARFIFGDNTSQIRAFCAAVPNEFAQMCGK